jgi:adenylate kinase
MSSSEVIYLGEFGKVTVVELGSNTTKICANIVNYTEVCLTLEVKPLVQEAEKIIKELFEKYKKIVIEGFIKGLQYAVTMAEVEEKAEKSVVYT